MQVAYWSVCLQIISAIQTMYNPIIDGIYPEMVKNKDFKLIKSILKIFMPLILAGSVFSWIVAPFALRIVGGIQYVSATDLFRCLIPVLIFSFPAMVFGWPTMGTVGMQKQVTESTIITAIFQVVGIGILILTDYFNVINLALLRGTTEAVLFLQRLRYCHKILK